MPRRKQEAPKRAAAYSPEEMKEEVEEEDVDFPEEVESSENDLLTKEPLGDQDSIAGAELSAQEMDSESHVSEASDPLSDFETASVKSEGPAKELLNGTGVRVGTPLGLDTPLAQDTLEQMKAIYSSFLTNSYWSPLNFNSALTQTPSPVEKPPRTSSTSSSCSSSSYDWHQSAVAKSLQQQASQSLYNPPPSEPSIFSTVQLHRQNPRLYGNIFTGASKFRCKGCSAAYDTLVDLTVHMNDTGHYRDDNHDRGANGARGRWSKPRKRSLLELEGKEDAAKVLKCMYCGHSFESLQDLSVHMIKTKHYQKVPLKEPLAPVAAKMISRKRGPLSGSLDLPGSPRSREVTPKPKAFVGSDHNIPSNKASNPYITPNNRFGHQNGASYTWQFESRKSQILKCMECGSSHNTLQELTAHMMVTGHFLRVTNGNPPSKRGRPVPEATSPSPVQATPTNEEQVQSIPLAPSTFSPPPPSAVSPRAISPPLKDIKKEEMEEEFTQDMVSHDKQVLNGDDDDEVEEKFDISTKYNYLTEEDLKESPKGGFDILKSLENTVTSAINKAQSGNPSWGGYPSIHAAYQFPNSLNMPQGSPEKSSPVKYLFSGGEGGLSSLSMSQSPIFPPDSQSSALPHLNNFQAMEELVKKVTEKVAKVERRVKSEVSPKKEVNLSPYSSEGWESTGADSPREWRSVTLASSNRGSHSDRVSLSERECMREMIQSPASALSCSTAFITGHNPLEQPFVNPLSALQSVMNIHLGKAAKPTLPSQDPLSLMSRLSQTMAERAAVAAPPTHNKKHPVPAARSSVCQSSDDQPMDLTKGKSDRGGSIGSAPLTPSSTASSISPSSMVIPAKMTVVSPFTSSSPHHENALSDISDMLRNLTQSAHHISMPPSRTRITERVTDMVGSTTAEDAEGSMANKRKGRQSNWNPQHLILLQAQFSSSLRQTTEGKYIMSDLSPQERMHVSRFTGLSMTTISHWLANVKYQLRRTGRTKFLKNLDSGHPVFFCSECASQIRTPTAYICHLEAHLGFRLKDLAKLSPKQTLRDSLKGGSDKLPQPDPFLLSSPPSSQSLEEASGTVYRCQLCIRKFASKHAIKLHLSKSHGMSPEDHLLYVSEMEKHK
ncbi:teashirt homolog 3-like [Oncorhynchus kisutch]|uniref:Teashirt zinc finger homeobox 3a n=1 Tax=Oncorhynchus kisutch TaxID=8019 RepID=A0A8C7F6V8_ONCKI|nr:teashirt homolog 3-like [Oncorhynchus kisutch]